MLKICNNFWVFFKIGLFTFGGGYAMISVISHEVVEKRDIVLPATLTNVVRCANPVCITNNEPMNTLFTVDAEHQCVRCHYCGKTQQIGNIKILK